LHALAETDGLVAFSAFIVAAVTVTGLRMALALSVGYAQERVIRAMRESSRYVHRWSGAILILVGAWLILLSVWAQQFARVFPV